jgi:hypothetical protein
MTRATPFALLLLVAGCAAPKDSYKSFPRPKYDVRQHARNGTPSVAQKWWKKAWFWQPMGGNNRKGKSIRIR